MYMTISRREIVPMTSRDRYHHPLPCPGAGRQRFLHAQSMPHPHRACKRRRSCCVHVLPSRIHLTRGPDSLLRHSRSSCVPHRRRLSSFLPGVVGPRPSSPGLSVQGCIYCGARSCPPAAPKLSTLPVLVVGQGCLLLLH